MTVNAAVDLSSSTLSLTSVEQISLVGGGATQTFAASYMSGKSFIVTHSGGAANLTISMDQTSVDLSGLGFASAFAAGDTITIDGSALGLANNITGSAAIDTITGGGAGDTISGGSGADIIDGNGGVDTITGGAGDDDFIFNDGDSGVTVATADVITDFVTTSDDIDIGGYVSGTSAITAVDGSGMADFAAVVTAADTWFAAQGAGNDDIYIAWDAAGSGNAYVMVDVDQSDAFAAGDTLIVLTGINAASEIATGDFI